METLTLKLLIKLESTLKKLGAFMSMTKNLPFSFKLTKVSTNHLIMSNLEFLSWMVKQNHSNSTTLKYL